MPCCGKVQQLLGDIGGIHVAAAKRVGVDAQRGAGVSVSHARCNGDGINGVGQQNGGVRVPLRYNNDKQKKPLFSRGLSVCRLLFNSFSKLKIDENYKEKRRLFY